MWVCRGSPRRCRRLLRLVQPRLRPLQRKNRSGAFPLSLLRGTGRTSPSSAIEADAARLASTVNSGDANTSTSTGADSGVVATTFGTHPGSYPSLIHERQSGSCSTAARQVERETVGASTCRGCGSIMALLPSQALFSMRTGRTSSGSTCIPASRFSGSRGCWE